MKGISFFRILTILALLFAACKSKPVPQEEPTPSAPSAALTFTGVQADDVEHLKVSCILEAKVQSGSRAKIESWRVLMDGEDASFAFGLNYPQGDFSLDSPLPLTLSVDIAALAAKGLAPKDDYAITLITELDVLSGPASPAKITAQGTANFPGVQAPAFNITSIAILKAELINTRFRVSMRIDNPNPFPLEMSGFIYELYGNGRLWADGMEKNVFVINGKSSVQGYLYLLMNFIDMERSLLDQIINLVDVNYRFAGEAQVSTGIDYLPKFNAGFDLSGYSEVLEK
jgi:LEA14-like dessication related protein